MVSQRLRQGSGRMCAARSSWTLGIDRIGGRLADVSILLIMLGSTLIGVLRGIVREAVSVAIWILAIWASWKFGPAVEPHLGGLLADPHVAPWAGRLVILALVLLVGGLVGMLLGYFARSVGLGPMDRFIGLLFGVVRGMVLV